MIRGTSLLTNLQRLIETTYDWNTGIEDLGPYLVGDRGYQELYGGREIQEEAPGPETGPRTLVTWRGGPIGLRIYYPDSLVRHLEAVNPMREVSESNVVEFSLLVEELDHLLMLAWCARHGRGVRLVELEFHANVTKYFVLAHFLGKATRRRQLTSTQRKWLHRHLFWGMGEEVPEPLGFRYRSAARLAGKFVRYMEELSPADRITVLRRFARRSWESQRSSLDSLEFYSGSRFLLVV